MTRISTVGPERGGADTVRDVRGFAIKFYTEEGNNDWVSNNTVGLFLSCVRREYFPFLLTILAYFLCSRSYQVHFHEPIPQAPPADEHTGANNVLGVGNTCH